MSADFSARFWSKVDRSGECWEWTACRASSGYGKLSVARIPRLAHRLSWEFANGPIPEGLYVCHHCDNPPCVRPDHLFLGTAADNAADMLAKGRGSAPPHYLGHDHHFVVVTDSEVRAARESYAAGRESQKQIAARLSTSPSTVRQWMSGVARLAAGGPITTPTPRRKRKLAVAA